MESLRTRAWWAIRKHKSITLVDLLAEICDGSEKSPKANLSRWLKELVAAGVISIEQVDDGVGANTRIVSNPFFKCCQ